MALVRAAEDRQGSTLSFEAGRDKGGVLEGGGGALRRCCLRVWRALALPARAAALRVPEILLTWWWSGWGRAWREKWRGGKVTNARGDLAEGNTERYFCLFFRNSPPLLRSACILWRINFGEG